jgi:hypothetical protein
MEDPLRITSTRVPSWKLQCEALQNDGLPWQLSHVTTEEHEMFVHAFSARRGVEFVQDGMTVYFAGGIKSLN